MDVNEILMEQLIQANKTIEHLQQEVTYLRDMMQEMNRKMFGRSKESVIDDLMDSYLYSMKQLYQRYQLRKKILK